MGEVIKLFFISAIVSGLFRFLLLLLFKKLCFSEKFKILWEWKVLFLLSFNCSSLKGALLALPYLAKGTNYFSGEHYIGYYYAYYY